MSLYNLIKKTGFYKSVITDIRKQNGIRLEILKAQRFNSTIVDSEWLKYKNFSPGEWAAGYGLLYTIYCTLNSVKPRFLLEFGLGQSSKMVHQYANYFKADAVTFEHDAQWVVFFNAGRDGKYDIPIQLADLEEIEYKGYKTVTYKDMDVLLKGKTYDFVLVDGPFGSDHYSRSEVLDVVKGHLAPSFCIILDDTERTGEAETADEIKSELTARKIDFCSNVYKSLKHHTLICSSDWKFLTSL